MGFFYKRNKTSKIQHICQDFEINIKIKLKLVFYFLGVIIEYLISNDGLLCHPI